MDGSLPRPGMLTYGRGIKLIQGPIGKSYRKGEHPSPQEFSNNDSGPSRRWISSSYKFIQMWIPEPCPSGFYWQATLQDTQHGRHALKLWYPIPQNSFPN